MIIKPSTTPQRAFAIWSDCDSSLRKTHAKQSKPAAIERGSVAHILGHKPPCPLVKPGHW